MTQKKQTAKALAEKVMRNFDIDLMNVWIADCNNLRHMLICGGIEPKWPEMQPLSYPD